MPRNIREFKQKVHENWKSKESCCNGCVNRNIKELCHPQFGIGDPNADIMFVGNSPGAPEKYEKDNENRQLDPEKLSSAPEFDREKTHKEVEKEYYLEEITAGKSGNTMKKYLFDNGDGLDMTFQDIYFTNIKKCSDVHNKSNQEARESCRNYIGEEISIVSPKVIVTWGMSPAKGVTKVLGLDSNLPDKTMNLISGNVQIEDCPIGYWNAKIYLITMPHWSGLRGDNLKELPNQLKENDHPVIKTYHSLADAVRILRKY